MLTDPLLDFLDHLVIDLPNIDLAHNWITLHIRDMRCTHFFIDRIYSVASDTDTNIDTVLLNMTIPTLSAVCTGRYASTGASGTVTVKLHSASPEAVRLLCEVVDSRAASNNNNHTIIVPDRIHIPQCDMHVQVSDLHFTGSFSAKLVDLFRNQIINVINKRVSSEHLCIIVQEQGLSILNSYLHQALAFLKQYWENDDDKYETAVADRMDKRTLFLEKQQNDYTTSDTTTTIQFQQDLPVVYNTLRALNKDVLQPHLNVGLLPSHCGGPSEGVSGILRDLLPQPVSLPLHVSPVFELPDNNTELTLHVSQLSIGNIYDLQELSVLEPTPKNGLFDSLLATSQLTLSLHVNLTVARHEYTLFEEFDVLLDLHNVTIHNELLVNMDSAVLETLPTAALLQAVWYNDPDCLLSSFVQVKVEELKLIADQFKVVVSSQASDPLESDLDSLISTLLGVVTTRYPELVSKSVSGIARGPVVDRVNAFVQHRLNNNHAGNCTYQEGSPLFVNFTELGILRQMNRVLNASLPIINDYMDCTANWAALQAVRWFPNISSSIMLQDVVIVGAGGLNDLEIMAPFSDGVHLNTTVNWSRPQVFTSLSLDLFGVSTIVNTTIVLENIEFDTSALLKYDEHYFKKLTLDKLLSHSQCALLPAKEMNLFDVYKSSFGVFDMIVNVSVTDSNLTRQFDFDSTDFSEIQPAMASAFEWAMDSAKDFIVAGSKLGPMDSSHCEDSSYNGPSETDDRDSSTKGVSETSVLLLLFLVFVFAQPTILLMKRSRPSVENEENSSSQDMEEPLLDSSAHSSRQSETPRAINPSLLSRAPFLSQQIVPLCIVLSIALLVASNSTVGASVELVVAVDGHSFQLPSLFAFSLLNTAKSMFAAGIYPLLFLVVVFSGVWPYAKLFLLLMAWTVPELNLTPQNRGSLLLRLDALSKFSLVDAYVLVVMLVAFRYHLAASEDILLDVYVTPQFGFYGFLVATTLSLGIGHVMVYYHRHAERSIHSLPTESYCVLQHQFVVGGNVRRLSCKTRVVVLSLLWVVVLLLGFGMSLQSFEFDIGGIAGLLLGDARHNRYSLLSIGAAIPKSVERPGIGVYLLQIAFYFYAVITPFLALVSLLLLLVYPLSLSKQQLVLTIAEISNAWSAIEVFALSILAALWEISTFAEFIVGNRCDFVQEVMSQYDYETTCFEVNCRVSKSAIFLVVGVILNSAWVSIALRVVRICISERLRTEEGAVILSGSPLIRRLSALSGVFESDDQGEERGLSEQLSDSNVLADEDSASTDNWSEPTRDEEG